MAMGSRHTMEAMARMMMQPMGPPRIDIGEYPDGRLVQLLDLGPGKTAEIPIAPNFAVTLPHTRWYPDPDGQGWFLRRLPTERTQDD